MTYKPVGVNESSQFPPRVETHIQAKIDAAVNALINGAPGALDTLKELADQLASDESAAAALTTGLATKASITSLNTEIARAGAAEAALGTSIPTAINDRAPTHWDSVNVGTRVDTFMVRKTTDGDVASQISAFLADTALNGKRRLVGHALIGSTVTMPDDTWFDGAQCVIETTANSTRAMQVGSRCHIEHIRGLGKTTDYVASAGSSSQTKSGLYLNGASDVVIEEAVFEGYAESGIYAVNSPRGTIGRLYFDGVDGRSGISIPSNDARSRALTATGGCTDWNVERADIKNASLGIVTGYNETGWMVNTVRGTDIKGQHLLYLQSGDGLVVSDVQGRRVNFNVVKVQMGAGSPTDSLGMVIGNVVGYSADCALFITNTSADKSSANVTAWTPSTAAALDDMVSNGGNYYQCITDGTTASSGSGPTGSGAVITDGTVVWTYAGGTVRLFKGATVGQVTAYDCNRLALMNSMTAARVGSLSGQAIKKEAVSIQNVKDSDVDSITVNGTGWCGLYVRGGQGGSNERVTVHDMRIKNPNPQGYNPISGTVGAANGVGVYGSDALALQVTFDGFDIFADNGLMTHGMLFSGSTLVDTFGWRNGKTRGWTTAPMRFVTKPASVALWESIDAAGAVTNFPDSQSQNAGGYNTPGDNAFNGAAYDPLFATTNLSALTPGQLFAVRVRLTSSRTLPGFRYTTGAAATSPTSGQCFISVYEGIAGGALLGSTADLATVWTGGGGDKSDDLASAIAGRPLGSYVYVVFLFNGTTAPTIRGNTTSGKANLGTTTGTPRFGTGGTSLTAPPATLPTLSTSVLQPFIGIRSI